MDQDRRGAVKQSDGDVREGVMSGAHVSMGVQWGSVRVHSLLTSNRFTLLCPGPPPFFYVFFAADLDNYILRTNNNNIERGHER